jgi:plasmid stabilization system protein ParE
MVKRKIEWLVDAKFDLKDILNFYIERNGSAVYSRKLNTKFNKSIRLISKNPYIGIQSDISNVRSLITDDYQIIYEIFDHTILIIKIWDCRRNPMDKRIGQLIK